MSLDRIVRWKTTDRPTHFDVQNVLEDYVRDLGQVEWRVDRWFVTVPGCDSFSFRRSGPATDAQRAAWREHELEGEPRMFEVWPDADCVYVMTRQTDEITNAIAEGFARLLARGWRGEV